MESTCAMRTSRPRICGSRWRYSRPRASTPRSCTPSRYTIFRTAVTRARTWTWPVTEWSRFSKAAWAIHTQTWLGSLRPRSLPLQTIIASKMCQVPRRYLQAESVNSRAHLMSRNRHIEIGHDQFDLLRPIVLAGKNGLFKFSIRGLPTGSHVHNGAHV